MILYILGLAQTIDFILSVSFFRPAGRKNDTQMKHAVAGYERF
jgi:hypothetical protein